MIQTGLVSITFRQLSPQTIVELVCQAGLQSIEWGGDVHVPHGDRKQAAEVAQMTAEAGLTVSAYGSYYRVAESEAEGLNFAAVLESALALGAPLIRVWAGRKGSAEASAAYRAAVVADSRRIADMAAEEGVGVAYEFHGNTLTDTNESAVQLLAEVDHANIYTFWQPHNDSNDQTRHAGLRAILPKLTNLHLFFWESSRNRFPLADGESMWLPFLETVASTDQSHVASIEFVQDDAPENFLRDARALQRWLS